MPGDRRQILSLLRLPIPPLQPVETASVTFGPRLLAYGCSGNCSG